MSGAVRPSSESIAVINSLITVKITTHIEENQRCIRLGSYFMAAVWEAARYSRGGFSLCHAGRAYHVMVPGGSMFHLEPGTIILFTSRGYFFVFCNTIGAIGIVVFNGVKRVVVDVA